MLNRILLLSPPAEGQEAAGNSSMMSIIFFAAFSDFIFFHDSPAIKKSERTKIIFN